MHRLNLDGFGGRGGDQRCRYPICFNRRLRGPIAGFRRSAPGPDGRWFDGRGCRRADDTRSPSQPSPSSPIRSWTWAKVICRKVPVRSSRAIPQQPSGEGGMRHPEGADRERHGAFFTSAHGPAGSRRPPVCPPTPLHCGLHRPSGSDGQQFADCTGPPTGAAGNAGCGCGQT